MVLADFIASVPVLAKAQRKKLNQRKKTIVILVCACLLLAAITIGGLLAAETAVHADLGQKYLTPSLLHLFGTDQLGRDMLARVVKGLSTSILIGLGAASCSAVLALLFGSAAALLGKKVDTAITWLVDLMLGIPHLVLLILISYALGKGFWGITIGVAVTHWPSLSRVIRGEILQLKQTQYVKTAGKLGQSSWRIALKHLLPAIFPQFLVGLILLFPHAILHEAAITFLGFGLPPEQPAIGVILAESMKYLSVGMWWLAFFPGVALIGVVALFDLAGGSLRRLIDPHSAQE